MESSAKRTLEPELAPSAVDEQVEDVEGLYQHVLPGLNASQNIVNADNKIEDELEAVRVLKMYDHPAATAMLEELQQNSRHYPNEPYLSWQGDDDHVTWRCATGGMRTLMCRCSWCFDMVYQSEVYYPDCGPHRICQGCLRQSFTLASQDESMGIPGCCDLAFNTRNDPQLSSILGFTIVRRYMQAREEYAADNRTYCATKGCGIFIPPDLVTNGKFAQCCDCNRYTCTWCKEPEHRGKECVLDEDEQALADLAKERGWQKCFRCSRWIEREEGCDHMSYAPPLLPECATTDSHLY